MTRDEKNILQSLLTGERLEAWEPKALSRTIRKRLVQTVRRGRIGSYMSVTAYRLTESGTKAAIAQCRSLPPVRPDSRWFVRNQGPVQLDRWEDRYGVLSLIHPKRA